MLKDFHLNKLYALNFKNYDEVDLHLNKYVNCFIGDNGSGKTNILDAVYYLSFCKSYFHAADSYNIKFEAPYFILRGEFEKNNSVDVINCSVKRGQKKQFKKNKKDYDKLGDHIGQYPVVIISPYDTDLIQEGSETRRKFIDSIISQFDKDYLYGVIRYQKILKQRNALLKNFAEARIFDEESIEVWDQQLVPLGMKIHKKRKEFIYSFINTFDKYYNDLSGSEEKVGIHYESQLNDDDFGDLLLKNKRKDEILQYTSQGIHKDDLELTLHGQPVKKFGSQGQQKTFLIALKLAQFEYLSKIIGVKPILLLDDIFDKLDEKRVANLMRKVSDGIFGQVMVSDTDSDRIKKVFQHFDEDRVLIFTVNDGRIYKEKEESINT